ncbi:hypothetical protein [Enterococcus durans]|uniref:hypothetical protein n=1 Tax=Enterococcus durans TaxID=53345 RepID=UPI00164BEB1D|nr:hypothetical protein [Enterococcus durans]
MPRRSFDKAFKIAAVKLVTGRRIFLQSTSVKPNEFKLNLKSLSSEKKEQREQQI